MNLLPHRFPLIKVQHRSFLGVTHAHTNQVLVWLNTKLGEMMAKFPDMILSDAYMILVYFTKAKVTGSFEWDWGHKFPRIRAHCPRPVEYKDTASVSAANALSNSLVLIR
jgi:hypothetical protein